MRITELQAPQTARDVARTAGKQWVKLQTQDSTATAKLEKHGFKLLGQGVSGSVYEKDGYPYVLKIFGFDDGYKEWYKWCRAHQNNPYVPKIKGGLIKLANNVFGVRLEPLVRKPGMAQKICSDEFSDLVKWGTRPIEPMTYEFFQDDPQLFEVVDAIRELKSSGYSLDLHSGNILWRNDQPVIIDPIV